MRIVVACVNPVRRLDSSQWITMGVVTMHVHGLVRRDSAMSKRNGATLIPMIAVIVTLALAVQGSAFSTMSKAEAQESVGSSHCFQDCFNFPWDCNAVLTICGGWTQFCQAQGPSELGLECAVQGFICQGPSICRTIIPS